MESLAFIPDIQKSLSKASKLLTEIDELMSTDGDPKMISDKRAELRETLKRVSTIYPFL